MNLLIIKIKTLILFALIFLSFNMFSQQNNETISEEEETSSEYQEAEHEDTDTPYYGSDNQIQIGTTEYAVFQTESCNEGQDLYYNYTNEYTCKPKIAASIKIKIEIHMNNYMYNEGTVTINDLKKKEIIPIDIEHVKIDESGNYIFNFSISDQPHFFILNPSKKQFIWYSEWGHWMEHYYYK